MGVSSKKRRKIVVNGRNFVWRVIDKLPGYSLQVISEDKHFIVEYPWMSYDPFSYLEVIGKEFPGLPKAGQCVERVHCPQFGDLDAITPGMVRRLIDWALFSERKLIPVCLLGRPITPEGEELKKEQEEWGREFLEQLKQKHEGATFDADFLR
jgi:hypothetical protein